MIKNYNEFKQDFGNLFPYSKDFDFATVYSKTEFREYQFSDITDVEDSEKIDPEKIYKDTKIGICSQSGIDYVLIFKEDSICYCDPDSRAAGFTTDSCQYFVLDSLTCLSTGEAIDVLANGWDDMYDMIDNKDAVRKECDDLELNDLIYDN